MNARYLHPAGQGSAAPGLLHDDTIGPAARSCSARPAAAPPTRWCGWSCPRPQPALTAPSCCSAGITTESHARRLPPPTPRSPNSWGRREARGSRCCPSFPRPSPVPGRLGAAWERSPRRHAHFACQGRGTTVRSLWRIFWFSCPDQVPKVPAPSPNAHVRRRRPGAGWRHGKHGHISVRPRGGRRQRIAELDRRAASCDGHGTPSRHRSQHCARRGTTGRRPAGRRRARPA